MTFEDIEKTSLLRAGEKEPLKKRATVYTAEKIANARENVRKYDWAKAEKDEAVRVADGIISSLSLSGVRALVPSQEIYRSYAVNQPKGCLNCARAIDAFGNYPYKYDALRDPWKITCPACGMRFPSNDFESYYKSGLDENGVFHRKNADGKYLVNVLYPEKGEKWGVDDGTSYVHTDGEKYFFIAYYAHWALWGDDMFYSKGALEKGLITKLADSASLAYVFTGEQKYADACIVLLDRLAQLYPSYNVTDSPWSEGYRHSGVSAGKIVGSIWETVLVDHYTLAYDAVFTAYPHMSEDALSLLSEKRGGKVSYKQLMKTFEDNFLREIYRSVFNKNLDGNTGMNEQSLTFAAVVLDAKGVSDAWLYDVFNTTGGAVNRVFTDLIDADGWGAEASPNYNSLWLDRYLGTARILRGYRVGGDGESFDIFRDPKFRKMLPAIFFILATDKFIPCVGDTGSTGAALMLSDRKGAALDIERYLTEAYLSYGEDDCARMLYTLAKDRLSSLRLTVWDKDPESLGEKIRKIAEEKGGYPLSSHILAHYGLALLMNATDKAYASDKSRYVNPETVAGVYFGRSTAHGHADTLNLYLYGFSVDLAPDLGYPEFCDGSPNKKYWVSNTLCHNTVLVDDERQKEQIVARPKAFDDGEFVKLVSVDAPYVYPQTEKYGRTTALIRIDEENSYIADFFAVKGGSAHTYCFHPAESSALTTAGLRFVKQTDENGNYAGTLAGKDVAWGSAGCGSGFQYLDKVRTDESPEGVFSLDWKIVDTRDYTDAENMHLKLTVLEKTSKVSLARGTPPRNKPGNPASLDFIYAERKVENGAASLFSAVVEPYISDPLVASAEICPVAKNGEEYSGEEFRALKITLERGRVDYVCFSEDEKGEYTVDGKFSFKGFFGVYSTNGETSRVYNFKSVFTFPGEKPDAGSPLCATGKVLGFTKERSDRNFIRVSLDECADPSSLAGRYVYVDTPFGSGCYRILGAEFSEGAYTLDIGDITLMRSKGAYAVAEGQTLSIPFSYCRERP